MTNHPSFHPTDPAVDHDDVVTLGGIPSAAQRRARRDSAKPAPDERPTQPIMRTVGEMPRGGRPADEPPPTVARARDLAMRFLSGPIAQSEVGRAGAEEMARWIAVQPDYRTAIVEWLLATGRCEEARRTGGDPPVSAMERMDRAERALAGLVDGRWDGTDITDITDIEILALARSFREGSGTHALARATCQVALGIAGPVQRAAVGGAVVTDAEMVARARTWCAVQIYERQDRERHAAAPDPIDGPARYRGGQR